MTLYHVVLLCSLFSVQLLVEASRFGRNDPRCSVLCANSKSSDECRLCNTRIPMRFGKRSPDLPTHDYYYDLEENRKPNFHILAVITGNDPDASYNEEN
ncbi:hypothetical protein X975_07890, partial [Stegodyphus mimosarum]